MANTQQGLYANLRGKRILICEDNGVTIMAFSQGLKRMGMEIVGEARSGIEATKLGIELAPDVILMDLNLNRGLDGIDATERILAHHPAIPIIGISGITSRETMERALNAGMRAFIPKPVNSEQLCEYLSRLFSSPER